MNMRRSAFTLIELVVVVAIIGLLATGVMVGVDYVRTRARDSKRVADAATLQRSLGLYLANKGIFPVSAGQCVTGSDSVSNALLAEKVISGLTGDPRYPSTDPQCYWYQSDPTGSTYIFRYTLELDSGAGSQGPHELIQ